MTKHFLEQMTERKSGHIVSISSMVGLLASPLTVPYSATKFGINGFMSGLKEHLRLENSPIKTTCVFPHLLKTSQEVINLINPE